MGRLQYVLTVSTHTEDVTKTKKDENVIRALDPKYLSGTSFLDDTGGFQDRLQKNENVFKTSSIRLTVIRG